MGGGWVMRGEGLKYTREQMHSKQGALIAPCPVPPRPPTASKVTLSSLTELTEMLQKTKRGGEEQVGIYARDMR